MSRKHFEAIAEKVARNYQTAKDAGNTDAQVAIERTVGIMACTFVEANPKFDAKRFMVACGINL